ncbi:MAG TPA: hypothetical protein VFQ27_08715 [Xanthobacteraceae bacterium]|nr:hypothetical protein [Xanthobacteraceae bacterium]
MLFALYVVLVGSVTGLTILGHLLAREVALFRPYRPTAAQAAGTKPDLFPGLNLRPVPVIRAGRRR